jgi:hypothetical protein
MSRDLRFSIMSGSATATPRCPACSRTMRLEPCPDEPEYRGPARRRLQHRHQRKCARNRHYYCGHCNVWLKTPGQGESHAVVG